MIPATYEQVIDGKFCRFIAGDIKDGTATFCDQKHMPGTVYCEVHHKRCWTGRTAKDMAGEPSKGFALPEWRPEKALEARMRQRARG